MSKFICQQCKWGIHIHEQCLNEWLGSKCNCVKDRIVLCSICKKREATIKESEYMLQYATPDRLNEQWVYRILNNIPDLCKPCSDRLWSS